MCVPVAYLSAFSRVTYLLCAFGLPPSALLLTFPRRFRTAQLSKQLLIGGARVRLLVLLAVGKSSSRKCCIKTGSSKVQIVQKLTSPSSVPKQFPCSFVPRDKRARELILADIISC